MQTLFEVTWHSSKRPAQSLPLPGYQEGTRGIDNLYCTALSFPVPESKIAPFVRRSMCGAGGGCTWDEGALKYFLSLNFDSFCHPRVRVKYRELWTLQL